ncbi:hypothetical protein, partial [Roseiconus lacunae]
AYEMSPDDPLAPYRNGSEFDAEFCGESVSTRWPTTLFLAVIAFPILVVASLPAAHGLSRSTSIDDRITGCLIALTTFVPIMIAIPAIAFSSLRMRDGHWVARSVALALFAVSVGYGLFVSCMLLSGPLRGF